LALDLRQQQFLPALGAVDVAGAELGGEKVTFAIETDGMDPRPLICGLAMGQRCAEQHPNERGGSEIGITTIGIDLAKSVFAVSGADSSGRVVRRVGRPSPTWRSFLRNEEIGIAAIDMFVAVSASFRLLYVIIILAHGRRKIVRFDVTQHPTAAPAGN
jgi:hypothetical protein